MPGDTLKFVPFSSCVDPSFWHKLSQIKLDVDKLNEPTHKLWGYFNAVAPRGLNGILSVDCSSFNLSPDVAVGTVTCYGKIINKNTIEDFKAIDKAKFIANEGVNLLNDIKSNAFENPQLLLQFTVICFADLKKHKFTYWFSFPALNIVNCELNLPPYYADEVFTPDEIIYLNNIDKQKTFFVLNAAKTGFEVYDLKEGFNKMNGEGNWMLCFVDSTNNSSHPGWPLRNYLTLFAFHCPHWLKKPLQILCVRRQIQNGEWSAGKSLFLDVTLQVPEGGWDRDDCCVGWEKNERGNFGPRIADLHSSMDPLALAESSVDLNLKLMKWQVVPDLDLETVKNTKCLLLGAGTLGCVVARSLLAWGVRHITFVDNSVVSYSNPVRQNLFQFSDIGKPKAAAAAAALKAIFPPVSSAGETLSVPMPGHPVGESLLKETEETVKKLDQLIYDHDVVFLLMDSRESRWLPTVMGAAHGKLVMTAALGFDSYLAMRHGLKKGSSTLQPQLKIESIPGEHLGCYFCSDVTIPGNSSNARTLDQQCTVTRPGVSNIAGSIVVEIMVSVLQHTEKGYAPARTKPSNDEDCLLGMIPHSVRGSLNNFEIMAPAFQAFSSCVACCDKVINEYRAKGFEFVHNVLESKKYLQDLTGLSELETNNLIDDVLEISSEEDNDV